MTWIQRHRLHYFLKDSIWVAPSLGIVAALILARFVLAFDHAVGWQMDLQPDAARTVLITLASSMFTFVVFVSSALLIALQLASAQLSPRIIALVFRDPITKAAMTIFMFNFTLAVAVVLRMGSWVPGLTLYVVAYGSVFSLGFFLYLIDHIGKMLRPNKALRTVALVGRTVIESVYPRTLTELRRATVTKSPDWTAGEQTCSIPARADGVILACDIHGIVAAAQQAECVLEMVPQVGDFVAKGSPLFHVYRSSPPFDVDGDDALASVVEVRQMVAIGQERSFEQDPAFAFRVIVDIACKALSPAINDPTTAVLAIDQLHHLLNKVGSRHLDDERVRDANGVVRLLCRTPGWDDFVKLAVTEIRQFGCQSIQVNRRLRAMLESLVEILPQARGAALYRELELLRRGAARFFAEPEDQGMAGVSDSQGVGGGSTEKNVGGRERARA